MEENYTYNPDQYWQDTEDSYPYYPTVRHRKRFILGTIKKYFPKGNFSAFDFGCGEGTLLKTIQDQYNLSSGQVGGCDISEQAIDGAKQKDTISARESISLPKLVGIPIKRAILPSTESNAAAARIK